MSTQPISLPSNHNGHSGHTYSGSGDYTMASGSYTGSSNGSFNPASYTRHFMGSPISWRAGSLGFGGRVFASGSPMDQLLGSIDPNDSRFNPSSLESKNADSIMNALTVFDPTDEIARDYTCCGNYLSDMHELLEHFEEIHVIYDPSYPEGKQARVKVPFNPQVFQRGGVQRVVGTSSPAFPPTGMLPIHPQSQVATHQTQTDAHQQHAQYLGSFDTDGMDLDMDTQQAFPQASSSQSSPSSGAPTPPDTPVSTPLTSYPSPTLYESPKALLNNGLHHIQTQTELYSHSPYQSPLTSQPPSPNSYHEADGGHGVPFETFIVRPQPIRSASSLEGALDETVPTGRRPQLNIALVPFSSRQHSTGAATGTMNALHPYSRYNVHLGMGANDDNVIGVDVGAINRDYHSAENSPVRAESCVPPALLFSNTNTPVATPSASRVPSPAPGQTARKPSGSAKGASGSSSKAAGSAARASSSLSRSSGSSLLLSKPFKCPKPNCNKSYKQANGLKYHITHGSCNFAPPKDLEQVHALLERKRRDKAAAEGASVVESEESNNPSPTGSGLNSPRSPTSFTDLAAISETELRDIEKEAEKRLKPYACSIGDCQRRYKNMNGLRYHYQHTPDHGAIGLGLLASGQHECLKLGDRSGHSSREASSVRDGVREGRKLKLTLGGRSSKPGSRAPSVGRDSKPQSPLQTQAPQSPITSPSTGTTVVSASSVPAAAAVTPSTSVFASNTLHPQTQAQVQAALAFQQQYMDHQRAQYVQQQQLALDQVQLKDQAQQMQAQIVAMQQRIYQPKSSSSALEGALAG